MTVHVFTTPALMGILNVTPDSFHDGGRYFTRQAAASRAFQMADEGADIIDVGGESTRPGSKPVSGQEELDRVCPAVEAAVSTGLPVSVDTTKSVVAAEVIRLGATIINDISGFTFDDKMPDVVAAGGALAVLMHIKGVPETMQSDTDYGDLVGEVAAFLKNAAGLATARGIPESKIILDPGIGFGKTFDGNYLILKNIKVFKELGFPLLIGLSRKSMIAGLYGPGEDRLPGTIALNSAAVMSGADIIRVHDVRAHRLALDALIKLKGIS